MASEIYEPASVPEEGFQCPEPGCEQFLNASEEETVRRIVRVAPHGQVSIQFNSSDWLRLCCGHSLEVRVDKYALAKASVQLKSHSVSR